MDQFYQKIQTLLMKKEDDYGNLCIMSSIIDAEASTYIDIILENVVEICEECEIPIGKKDLHKVHESIEAFKFFLLNTDLGCQRDLREDEEYGNLVGMCPLLSPYLLVEILWRLNFQTILAHSVPFLPVDLTVELLMTINANIDTQDFDRRLELSTNLVQKLLQRMYLAKMNGFQSKNPEKSLKNLCSIAEGFIFKFYDERFLELSELKGNAKYERVGLALKQLLRIAEFSEGKEFSVVENLEDENRYKLSFGRMEFSKSEKVDEYLELLCKDIVLMLKRKVKDVDINCYMSWVEVEDQENPSITLQRAIGHKAYFFVEKFGDHEQLGDCLGNFVVKPKEETRVAYFAMTLEELVGKLEEENEGACMKEIMKRYKFWDHKTFDSVKKHSSLMDTEDASVLLDYLVTVIKGSDNEELKNSIHQETLMTLIRLDSKDFTSVILKFILKYDGSNVLECKETKSQFCKFVERNPNFSQSVDYRRLLIFLMKNPREIMKILVKVAIGHKDFENVMFSMRDFFLLEPFMLVKDYQNNSLLLTALRDVLLENIECKMKRLKELLENVIKVWPSRKKVIDEIAEVVLIPYLLQNSYDPVCLKAVLVSSENILPMYKDSSKTLMGLAKKLSHARKDKKFSRFETSGVVGLLDPAMNLCCKKYEANLLLDKLAIVARIDPFLSPYDSMKLWNAYRTLLYVPTIFHKYQRLCFSAMVKVQNFPNMDANLKRYLEEFTFQKEDFRRHMLLSLTVWDSLEPFPIISQFRDSNHTCGIVETGVIIGQACRLCLEYPEDFAPLAFPCLLMVSLQILRSNWEITEHEEFLKSLRRILKDIECSVRGTPYAEHYEVVSDAAPIGLQGDPYQFSEQIVRLLEQFVIDCGKVRGNYSFSGERCSRITRYRISHHFIDACLAVTKAETKDCLMEMSKILDFRCE